MTSLSSVEILTGLPTGNPIDMYANHHIRSEQGTLSARHSYEDNVYDIRMFSVYEAYQRQGYGKELLRLAYQHARVLGAAAISASNIITRESIDALTSVFGGSDIDIESLGNYALDGHFVHQYSPTKASMRHTLSETNNDTSYNAIVTASVKNISPETQTLNDDLFTIADQLREIKDKSEKWPWGMSEADAQEYDNLAERWQKILDQRDWSQKRYEALAYGEALKHIDEVNLADYAYILEPPRVEEHFRIPKDIDLSDKKRVYFALENLPFHNLKTSHNMSFSSTRTEVIEGVINFPVDRIIGVNSFLSWSGRGLQLHDSNPDYSLERIIQYAKTPANAFKETSNKGHIVIVKDLEEKLWGVVTTDGSHRTAAAKLRGDTYIELSRVTIPDIAEMTTIPLKHTTI